MPESNPPPSLPEVYDEAGDSPRWLPALGFGLLVLFALVLGTQLKTASPAEPPPPPAAASDAPQAHS
jgi:hypothetical protein